MALCYDQVALKAQRESHFWCFPCKLFLDNLEAFQLLYNCFHVMVDKQKPLNNNLI